MSTTFSIRPATPEDIPAMTGLLQELFSLEADFEPRPEVQERGLEAFLADGSGRTALVAETDEKVIGMVTAQIVISTAEGGPAGLVEDMVISKPFQGLGLGRILIAALTDWAREQGISRLQLLADRDNAPALRFYEHQGWQRTQLICLRTRT